MERLNTIGFHSDVSYEHQPPGITLLALLSVPETGGDTTWASQTAAYSRLSTPIKTLLEGLKAEHSGFPQAENARRDGKHVRREPVKSEHPIVRIHPVSFETNLIDAAVADRLSRQRGKRLYISTQGSQRESLGSKLRSLTLCLTCFSRYDAL